MNPTSRLFSHFHQPRAEAADAVVRMASHAVVTRRMHAGACVAVQSGRVWLTQTGDANDYFIDAGRHHVVTRSGRVVIEAFSTLATLRLMADVAAAHPGFP